MKFKNGSAVWRESRGKTFSALFAGDICPRNTGDQIAAGKSKEIFAGVKPFFQSADLRIVQWETTLGDFQTPIDKCGPNLKVRPECVDIAVELGAEIALLANNHIGDFGPDGVMETIDRLRKAGIKTVGAGKNLEEAGEPLRFKCGKISISLLNYAENEFGIARKNRAGTAPQSVLKNIAAIKAEKQNSDLVFVALHGGHEYNPYPSPRMVETCRAFIDAGADLLWNCHPHCPEGMEVYNGKPIIYSPGNFYFPSASPDYRKIWYYGYLTKFLFDADGVYGVEILPYRQDADQVAPLAGKKAKEFFDYMTELCRPLSDPEELQRKFEIWCMISGIDYLSLYRNIRELGDWEPDWRDRDKVKLALGPRNLHTCESHHDLMRQTLLMIEEYRVTEMKKHVGEITSMWTPVFCD